MRNNIILALATVIMMSCSAQSGQKDKTEVDLSSTSGRASYSLGVLMGQNFMKDGITEIDPEALAKAIDDVLNDRELEIDAATCQTEWQDFMQAQMSKKSEAAKSVGKQFLDENAKKEGVTVLPDGLQYIVEKEGTGPKPGPTDKVKVHYHGTLINGTVFDSSVDRGEPVTFPVNGVIKGWTEALQLMPVGSKWKLFIPSELAYGERGAGGAIGPNEVLIFDVELLEIVQ